MCHRKNAFLNNFKLQTLHEEKKLTQKRTEKENAINQKQLKKRSKQ